MSPPANEDAIEVYTPERPYTIYTRTSSEKRLWLPKLRETIYHHLLKEGKCLRSDRCDAGLIALFRGFLPTSLNNCLFRLVRGRKPGYYCSSYSDSSWLLLQLLFRLVLAIIAALIQTRPWQKAWLLLQLLFRLVRGTKPGYYCSSYSDSSVAESLAIIAALIQTRPWQKAWLLLQLLFRLVRGTKPGYYCSSYSDSSWLLLQLLFRLVRGRKPGYYCSS